MQEASDWCTGPDGRRLAHALLRRSRLPLDVDDLIGEVVVKVATAIHNKPGNFEQFVAGAYCRTVMNNTVRQWRSRRSDVETVPFVDPDRWVPSHCESAPSAVGGIDLEDFHAAVEALGTDPVHVAAAITVTYLLTFDEIVFEDAPRPRAGVRKDLQCAWPALWLATRRPALFPAGDGRRDGQARTRQRHLDKIQSLRMRAYLAVMGTAPS